MPTDENTVENGAADSVESGNSTDQNAVEHAAFLARIETLENRVNNISEVFGGKF